MNPRPPIDRARLVAAGLCAALLVTMGVLSYTAVRGKSATYDEPLHLVGGAVKSRDNDHRINPEDPALFGRIAGGATSPGRLPLNRQSADFEQAVGLISHQWPFSIAALYQTRGVDADAVLNRARLRFVAIGVALGVVVVVWSWQLAGAAAGLVAAGLVAFDPNLAAHMALVKNDVPLAAVFIALAWALWRLGRHGGAGALAAVALLAAAAVNIKFSGLLAGPIIAAVLVIRATVPRPWRLAGVALRTLPQRLAGAAGALALTSLVAWAGIWACYGFRFAATGDGRLLNFTVVEELSKRNRAILDLGGARPATEEEIAATPIPAAMRGVRWAMDRGLLPQGWLYGFGYTYATTLVRSAFLLGDRSVIGFRSYFPIAMLVKTPTMALLAAGGLAAWAILRARRRDGAARRRGWALACLAIPAGFYALSAVTTNLNLGLRHVLPLYPFIYVACGVMAAALLARLGRGAAVIAIVAGALHAAESLRAWPDYLPFFNTLARTWRDPLDILADSNLDWGQDLRQLGRFMESRRREQLYLAYFGTADPAYYGMAAVHLPGGWQFAIPRAPGNDPGLLAVSATVLQGVYLPPDLAADYAMLRAAKPLAVFGQTIYVYEWPVRRPPASGR